MHVCHIWHKFWPVEIGGLERYIIGLSHFLAQSEKMRFSLLTGRTKLLLVTEKVKKYEDAGWLKVYRLGPRPIDVVNSALSYVFRSRPAFLERMTLMSLCDEAVRWKPIKSVDVFHVHGIWSDLQYVKLGVFLSRHFNKPLLVSLHGSFAGSPSLGGMPLNTPEVKNILSHHADAIITYSEEILSTLKRMDLSHKSFLITNFVDTKYFSRPTSPDSHSGDRVVFVSRLTPGLNPALPIRAFYLVNKEAPNARLQIIGYGELYEYLNSLVRDLNLEGVVTLVGKQIDVEKFLWNNDIFVANKFGYIATLEAWASGLAVIVPNFGVLKEIISDGKDGVLVPPDDFEQLASAIISLIRNKKLRTSLALNGIQTVKKYDIRNVAPQVASIYNSLVEKDAR